ncbi:MAG: DUF1800 domain-containing protein [Planctomycetia bacterium]|nr:MAG: DUF1800 domain-containing protein [Planctomycetia bacterium]
MAARIPALILATTLLATATGQTSPGLSMKPIREDEWTRDAAAHLLRRAAFGGTPEQIERLHLGGMDAAVSSLLSHSTDEYKPPQPAIDPILNEPPDRAALRVMTDEERREQQQKRQMAERRSIEEVRLWWLDRLAHSPFPAEEKLVLFWHGHFTSGVREVRNAIYMKEQNEMFRSKALGNFRDLLIAVSKDRAMLVYLDNARNVKRSPNENYARELLELFTLGLGNYTENDVKAAARAFTGWGFDQDGFLFRRDQHDFDEKTFLGRRGRWDGGEIIDILLTKNECSQFLARKLLGFYVRPDPPRSLVNAFAAVIRRNKYDIRASLDVLFRSQAFYHADSRGCLIKSPTELLIGAVRQFELPLVDLLGAERALAGMGQELMQPPNVKGWDGGEKWINTATLFARYNVVSSLLRGETSAGGRRFRAQAGRDNDEEAGSMMAMTARSRMAAGTPTAYDPLQALRGAATTPEDIVDFFTRHLLATPLPSIKREQLIDYVRGPGGSFSPSARDTAERIRTLVQLLTATPEYQLN